MRSPDGCSPSCSASAGLGSNVSTCDGAPFMNRNITRLALGAKCGINRSRKAPAGASGEKAAWRSPLPLATSRAFADCPAGHPGVQQKPRPRLADVARRLLVEGRRPSRGRIVGAKPRRLPLRPRGFPDIGRRPGDRPPCPHPGRDRTDGSSRGHADRRSQRLPLGPARPDPATPFGLVRLLGSGPGRLRSHKAFRSKHLTKNTGHGIRKLCLFMNTNAKRAATDSRHCKRWPTRRSRPA